MSAAKGKEYCAGQDAAASAWLSQKPDARLDTLGPHLALLRPHMPLLLPHMPVIARNVDAFIPFVSVSANADILLHYFGWLLRAGSRTIG